MNTSAKLIDAMMNNPSGWSIDQLQTVARSAGVGWRQRRGSHCTFTRQDGQILTIPAHRPINQGYVRKFIQFVKEG
ncbi:MAG: type II toxin-antitoxin system HicA family toxin [Magnetococcales bacterium]|nr:type II toxin-antitoxin system HicA family toxin [Magnetococcales bacterium]